MLDDSSDYVQPTPTLATDSSIGSRELRQEVGQESMDVCGILI